MIIGYYSLGQCGYEIIEIEHGIDDLIKWRFVGTEPENKIHTSKIYTCTKGRAYFRPYGKQRVYLDEIQCRNNL